jgi:adhesin HecA-like repeat protein
LINAPGTLLLKNLNGVNNHSGEISSQQAFTLAANDLDNSNGKLISQQADAAMRQRAEQPQRRDFCGGTR